MLWRVCERFNILPPAIQAEFDKNTPWQQAQIFAYEQIRQYEQQEELLYVAGAGLMKRINK